MTDEELLSNDYVFIACFIKLSSHLSSEYFSFIKISFFHLIL